jgi:hypothetical protein
MCCLVVAIVIKSPFELQKSLPFEPSNGRFPFKLVQQFSNSKCLSVRKVRQSSQSAAIPTNLLSMHNNTSTVQDKREASSGKSRHTCVQFIFDSQTSRVVL